MACPRTIRRSAPAVLVTTFAAALLGGCSSSHWSPTGDALAGANRRSEYIARAESPYGATQTVVLSQDSYGRMASPAAIMNDASNTTVTAGVETAE
jgi:hypothetical protein